MQTVEEGSGLPPACTELHVCSDDAITSEGVTTPAIRGQQEVRRGKGLNDNNSNTHDLQSRAEEAHFHLLHVAINTGITHYLNSPFYIYHLHTISAFLHMRKLKLRNKQTKSLFRRGLNLNSGL